MILNYKVTAEDSWQVYDGGARVRNGNKLGPDNSMKLILLRNLVNLNNKLGIRVAILKAEFVIGLNRGVVFLIF